MLTNEEVVRAYYAAVDRGVIDNVVDIFAPDAEYYRPGYPPMHGREQLRNFYTNERVLIGGQHIIELVVIDDSAALRDHATRLPDLMVRGNRTFAPRSMPSAYLVIERAKPLLWG